MPQENTTELITTSTESQVTQSNIDYLKYVGGRKFSLAILSLVSASVLVWFGKIDAGIYSVVVVTLLGAYTAGNVTQNLKTN